METATEKTKNRSVSDVIAEARVLIETSKTAIAYGDEAKVRGDRALAYKKLILLKELLRENTELFPRSDSFNAIYHNIAALTDEMRDGGHVDLKLVNQMEASIHNLAKQHTLPRRHQE